MNRILLCVAFAMLLVGCDDMSSPLDNFSTPFVVGDRAKPIRDIFTLQDSASVAVAPIAGVAPGTRDKLAGAVADALQKLDILATAGDVAGDRLSLLGTARATGTSVAIDWRLIDSAGKAVGHATSDAPVALEALNRGDQGAIKTLARASATTVAGLLQDYISVEAAAQDTRRVFVQPVTGAPGDGTESLRLAMSSALTLAKLNVVPASGDTASALAVVGSVKLDPPKDGKQHIAINWSLLDAHGRQLGVVSQENNVRPGSLDGRWGEVANLVASAAAPGIVALISKAEQTKPAS